ncbi:hypothetical protein [Sphingomonas montana]|uniref:hypothetical protein n=1 Tax=Sphingomonas montana TaxID=1843236 RepID=UPI00096FA934|nr:hypothetical protein [Sphingomonas montana]
MTGRYWRTGIVAALTILATPVAAAQWFEARSDHFVIYAPGSADTARDYATRLERFDKGLRVIRKRPDRPSDRSNPLFIYVLDNPAAVERLCGANGKRKPATCRNVAGFYQPRASGSVAFTPRRSGDGGKFDLDAQTVLFHEYAHHFMFANYTAAYPSWFTEGFAEFNGTARFERDGGLGFGIPALYRGYSLLRGQPMPVAELLTVDNRKLKPEQRSVLYGRGWLLTHYLTFDKERDGQLGRYLTALNDGRSSLDAATAAFGDLKQLDRDLDRYLMASRMKYLVIGKDRLPIGDIAVRPLTPGETAMLPVRMRSERGVDAVAGRDVAAQARLLAAPYPNDVMVQTWLAEAEYDARRDDLAEAAADRALAADPKARDAMLYKGRAHVRRAVLAHATDPAVWKEARSWFIKANRLDPEAAEPLMLFYDSFRAARVRPSDNAVLGLEKAFVLAPQDGGLRFRLAREYLRDNKRAEAKLVLAPLAYDPHSGPDNPAARLIARIDTADAATLRAAADEGSPDDQDDSN